MQADKAAAVEGGGSGGGSGEGESNDFLRQKRLKIKELLVLSSPLVTSNSIPSISAAENRRFRGFKKNALRTDGTTDGPTDGRTDPLIEMRGRI